jgi:hypothetical protein
MRRKDLSSLLRSSDPRALKTGRSVYSCFLQILSAGSSSSFTLRTFSEDLSRKFTKILIETW